MSLNSKHVLAGVVTAAVSAALVFLLGAAGALPVLAFLLIAAVKWAAKKDKAKFRSRPPEESGQGSMEPSAPQEPSPPEPSIRTKDLVVMLIFFTVVPMVLAVLLALPTGAGQMLSKNMSDPSARLSFWNAVLGIINGLL